MEAEKRVVISPSSQRKRKRRRIRRILRERRRRNEKRVIAPSSLSNDVVEEIFLRLPVKALIRLKSLSKQWRSTIESRSFEERHLKIARVGRPKIIFVSEEDPYKGLPEGRRTDTDIGFRTFCLETASHLSFTFVNFPQGFFYWLFLVSESCDGLFCIHSPISPSVYLVNPATKWLRQLPPARFQILMQKFNPPVTDMNMGSVFHLAFVKAADYKLVWLYNSDKYNADASSPNEGVTKCEVFDFRANAWRSLACTPSYRIFHDQKPAIANGSVYWLTEPYNARIEVVAFDIHTETFRLLPKIIPASDPHHITMCSLDNRLCMSKKEGDATIQDIWRLEPSEDTWDKILTIDLISCSSSRAGDFLIGARRMWLSHPQSWQYARTRRFCSHITVPEVW